MARKQRQGRPTPKQRLAHLKRMLTESVKTSRIRLNASFMGNEAALRADIRREIKKLERVCKTKRSGL